MQALTNGALMSNMVCKDCGTVGETTTETRGSRFIELLAWLCFLIPGLIYSMWRMSTKHETCRACGSEKILPVDSPIGRQMAQSVGYVSRAPSSAASDLGRSLGELVRRLKK
jgi:hypothetical protein